MSARGRAAFARESRGRAAEIERETFGTEKRRTLSSPPSASVFSALPSFVASSAGVRLCFLKNDAIAREGSRLGGRRAPGPIWRPTRARRVGKEKGGRAFG